MEPHDLIALALAVAFILLAAAWMMKRPPEPPEPPGDDLAAAIANPRGRGPSTPARIDPPPPV